MTTANPFPGPARTPPAAAPRDLARDASPARPSPPEGGPGPAPAPDRRRFLRMPARPATPVR